MFDVYVSGIDPTRIGDYESIKKNVAETLNAEGETLEQLLSPKDGAICIKENISEKHAIKIRSVLLELGLICSYELRKNSRWGELSIEAKDEQAVDILTCPACNSQLYLEEEREPKFCPNCRVDVDAYRQKKKAEEEYEEIRKVLLQKAQSRLEYEEQAKLKETLQNRKAQMEEKISKELGLDPKPGWKSFLDLKDVSKSYLITAAIIAVSLTGLVIFKLLPNRNASESSLTTEIPEASVMPEQSTASQTMNVSESKDISANSEQAAVPVVSAAELPGQDDIIAATPSSNTQGLEGQEGHTPAQASLAKAHNDVSKFMKSLGIEAMPNPVGGLANAPIDKVKNSVRGADTPVLSATSSAASTSALVATEKRLFVDSIYSELDADVEWDAFLNKKAKELIKLGKLRSAYSLSQFQTNLTDHIDVIGELTTAFSKLDRNDLAAATTSKLNQRIQAEPQEMQAVYKAQLAIYTQGAEKNKQTLFEDAERLALSIPDALMQSKALSKIAAYERIGGMTLNSAKNFSLAQEKLNSAATPSFEQFSGYINLADNYMQAGNTINAEVAMSLAEISLAKLDASKQTEGWAMLLNTAYLTSDLVLINKYSSLTQPSGYRSKSAYQSIQTQLKVSLPLNVAQQLANISDNDFLAVATAMAGFFEKDPIPQKSLVDLAQQKLLFLQDNESKAVASSKVARYFFRQGKDKEGLALFDQALSAAQSIQNPKQRDAAFYLIVMDKARVFLSDSANQIASLINDDQLKSAAIDMLNNSKKVTVIVTN